MDVTSKAVVLDALQRLKLSAHPLAETIVKNVIENTKLDDLSRLKSLADTKGDVNSIHKLIYTDIKNDFVRLKILHHIKRQANIQKASMMMNGKSFIYIVYFLQTLL